MSSSRQLRKRLDAALRALSQIECIADVTLERHQGDSDLHWVLDGVGDLAHYALEVAGDPPRREAEPGVEAEAPYDEDAVCAAAAGDPGEGPDPDDDEQRRHH
ncbi:MAG: hypothetical protein JXB32_26155 [Deltaproteobacteria bacterium]|nr:hypothetical protein [Deltaproteobacteria bacterium]